MHARGPGDPAASCVDCHYFRDGRISRTTSASCIALGRRALNSAGSLAWSGIWRRRWDYFCSSPRTPLPRRPSRRRGYRSWAPSRPNCPPHVAKSVSVHKRGLSSIWRQVAAKLIRQSRRGMSPLAKIQRPTRWLPIAAPSRQRPNLIVIAEEGT